jgi:hypothetical protein
MDLRFIISVCLIMTKEKKIQYSTGINVYVRMCVCLCACVCMFACVCVYVRAYVCLHVCVCLSDHLSPCALPLPLSGPPARLPSHPFSTDLFDSTEV